MLHYSDPKEVEGRGWQTTVTINVDTKNGNFCDTTLGTGRTKQVARHDAAEAALEKLENWMEGDDGASNGKGGANSDSCATADTRCSANVTSDSADVSLESNDDTGEVGATGIEKQLFKLLEEAEEDGFFTQDEDRMRIIRACERHKITSLRHFFHIKEEYLVEAKVSEVAISKVLEMRDEESRKFKKDKQVKEKLQWQSSGDAGTTTELLRYIDSIQSVVTELRQSQTDSISVASSTDYLEEVFPRLKNCLLQMQVHITSCGVLDWNFDHLGGVTDYLKKEWLSPDKLEVLCKKVGRICEEDIQSQDQLISAICRVNDGGNSVKHEGLRASADAARQKMAAKHLARAS